MRRFIMLVTAALLMTAMMVASVVPAFAEGQGPSACEDQQPGQYISGVAQDPGHSGENYPGNAKNEYLPFVPFAQNDPCNPNAT